MAQQVAVAVLYCPSESRLPIARALKDEADHELAMSHHTHLVAEKNQKSAAQDAWLM